MRPKDGHPLAPVTRAVWQLAGALVVASALLILVGWHTGLWWLAGPGDPGNPVRYNTAASLLAFGVGMVALAVGGTAVGVAASSAGLLVALLTIAEFLTGRDLGIDDPAGLAAVAGVSPRMALSTGLCLALTGASMLVAAWRRDGIWRFAVALAASLVGSVALVALVGPMFGIRAATAWGSSASMAPATAMLVTLLAFAIPIAMWHEGSEDAYGPTWLPIPIGCAILVASVILWQAVRAQEDTMARSWVRLIADDLASDVERKMAHNGVALQVLAARLRSALTADEWEIEAESYRASHPGILAVTLFGPQGETLGAAGDPGFFGIGAVDGSRQPPQAFTLSYSPVRVVLGRPITLIVVGTGDPSGSAGRVVAVADVSTTVDRVSGEQATVGREVAVFDEQNRPVVQPPERRLAQMEHWAQSADVVLSDLRLRIRLTPASSGPVALAHNAAAPWFIVAGGVTLAGLVGLVIALSQGAGRRSAQLQIDIARREQAEMEARSAHASLARAQRIASVGSWEWDLETDGVRWSDETWRIFGAEPGTFPLTSVSYLEWVHPDDRPAVQQAIAACLKGGRPLLLQHRLVRPDGTIRIAHALGELTLDAAGCPVGMAGAVMDVTEQRQAAETIERSERLLQLVLDNLPVGVFISDREGTLRTINHAAKAIWAGGPLVGIEEYGTYKGVWSGSMQPVLAEDWTLARTLRTGEAQLGDLVDIECFDGSKKTIVSSAVPIHEPGGALIGGVAMIEDITDRRRAEALLADRTRALERSNGELEQFAYVASHDLQEPLRMISSYTQLLAHRYASVFDDDAREFMAYTVDGAKRMQLLINALLAYARIGTRGVSMAMTPSGPAVDEALANLQMAIRESEAVVNVAPLPDVFADRGQLVQVLQNLVGNALKFRATERPAVRISAAIDGPMVRFAVSDNGIGFDPAHAERIFGVFQRLHGVGQYPGTGIGLAICKKIVQRHGGAIWVDSSPGLGSTFFFTMPADATVAAATLETAA